MVDTVKILDPVKGLVDYVNDIKPYHTKVIESLVEYIGTDAVDVRITEEFHLGIELLFTVGNPFCEDVIVNIDGQTVITTKREVVTNVKQASTPEGSPPIFPFIYDFYGTIVRLNGYLQQEITALTPDGDYILSGINEITFVNPTPLPGDDAVPKLKQGDIVDICTGTQEATFSTGCEDSGFGTLPFGDPIDVVVVSPNPAETVASFPALTSKTFIVSGNQELIFDPNNNLSFTITSFTEHKIISITPSTGGTGGQIVIDGIHPVLFPLNSVIAIKGSFENDGIFVISTLPQTAQNPPRTILEVNGDIPSGEADGFVGRVDSINSGSFTVIQSEYFQGNTPLIPYTLVTISGITLIPPSPVSDDDHRYVSIITSDGLDYTRVVSYSNAIKRIISGSPAEITHTPDEGVVFLPVLGLSQSPPYFEVEGDYIGSNLELGDSFEVIANNNNNGTYIITTITLIPEILGSPNNPVKTRFGVAAVHEAEIGDGIIRLDIPSNMFFVDGDYRDFFRQGTHASATDGSAIGDYAVLYSTFINGQTRIRVTKDIIKHSDIKVVAVSAPGTGRSFDVEGDVTTTFIGGVLFNVTNSYRNDGVYTVVSSTYVSTPNTTTIDVLEYVDGNDVSGELTVFESGTLRYKNTGFGETPEFCEIIPETMVRVDVKERLSIICEPTGSPIEDLGSPPMSPGSPSVPVEPCGGELIDQSYAINIATNQGIKNLSQHSTKFASATTGIADTTIIEKLSTVQGHIVPILGINTVDSTIHTIDSNGDIYDNITSSELGKINIQDSIDNDGAYTILSIERDVNLTPPHTILTVSPPIQHNAGVFAGSSPIDNGNLLYKQWFQYMIINTKENNILLFGDISENVSIGDDITIFNSNELSNNGKYTVIDIKQYDALTNTTSIYVSMNIPNEGRTGGWVI